MNQGRVESMVNSLSSDQMTTIWHLVHAQKVVKQRIALRCYFIPIPLYLEADGN